MTTQTMKLIRQEKAKKTSFIESTKTKVVSTPKTHCTALSVSSIIFDPSENYRWGSEEGMIRDLGLHVTPKEGAPLTTYQQVKQSISIQGMRDAIEVVKREDGYHIISGFTRTKIALELGLKTVPAYIYDSTLSEDEYEFLQLQENAQELHRDVNWVQEFEAFTSLCARYVKEDVESGPLAPGRDRYMTVLDAMVFVERIIGKNAQTMKNRKHWFSKAPARIQELSRQGVISCTCLQAFLSPDRTEVFSNEFVDEVLEYLEVEGVLPDVITPDQARRAVRNVKIRTANAVFGEDGERKSKNTSKTSAKIRQSVPVLRDLATVMACCHLTNTKITLDSSEAAIEELTESYEWAMYVGIGLGAGEVHVPPVLEQVLGDRKDDDAFVLSQDQQHQRTSDIYARTIFIRAFLMLALKANGVRDIGLVSEGGWLAKTSIVAKDKVIHRDVFYHAVKDAAELHDEKKPISLKTRALKAWAALKGTY